MLLCVVVYCFDGCREYYVDVCFVLDVDGLDTQLFVLFDFLLRLVEGGVYEKNVEKKQNKN
jgi:hypothetical protein